MSTPRNSHVSQAQVDALEVGDVFEPCFTSQQAAAFTFTEEVIQLIEVTDATYAEARRHFSDRAITSGLREGKGDRS